MKIKQSDYSELEIAIKKAIPYVPKRETFLTEGCYRWALYHKACDMNEGRFYRSLNYLDDSNIETALIRITGYTERITQKQFGEILKNREQS